MLDHAVETLAGLAIGAAFYWWFRSWVFSPGSALGDWLEFMAASILALGAAAGAGLLLRRWRPRLRRGARRAGPASAGG